MREGHFIGLNDRTTCGGTVLDGDTRIMMFGIAHARDGDRVTCGEDGKTYRIVGGISHMISHGKAMAGTLDSYSNCPCKARLIATVLTSTYQSASSPSLQATRVAEVEFCSKYSARYISRENIPWPLNRRSWPPFQR